MESHDSSIKATEAEGGGSHNIGGHCCCGTEIGAAVSAPEKNFDFTLLVLPNPAVALARPRALGRTDNYLYVASCTTHPRAGAPRVSRPEVVPCFLPSNEKTQSC